MHPDAQRSCDGAGIRPRAKLQLRIHRRHFSNKCANLRGRGRPQPARRAPHGGPHARVGDFEPARRGPIPPGFDRAHAHTHMNSHQQPQVNNRAVQRGHICPQFAPGTVTIPGDGRHWAAGLPVQSSVHNRACVMRRRPQIVIYTPLLEQPQQRAQVWLWRHHAIAPTRTCVCVCGHPTGGPSACGSDGSQAPRSTDARAARCHGWFHE